MGVLRLLVVHVQHLIVLDWLELNLLVVIVKIGNDQILLVPATFFGSLDPVAVSKILAQELLVDRQGSNHLVILKGLLHQVLLVEGCPV